MPDVGTTRSRHGPHLVPHSRGENPCTRRYCSCRPPWVGTLRLLRRWFPLAAPACPRQDRAAIPAATRGRASSPVCTHIMPQSRPVMIAASRSSPCPSRGRPGPPCCDSCSSGCQRANLLDKIRARGHHHHRKSDCCAADPCAAPYAAGGTPVMTPGSSGPPKEMPKPTTGGKPKDEEAAALPSRSHRRSRLFHPSPWREMERRTDRVLSPHTTGRLAFRQEGPVGWFFGNKRQPRLPINRGRIRIVSGVRPHGDVRPPEGAVGRKSHG